MRTYLAYTGLDRFNRLVETIWQNSSAKLVHSSYGRNRASGIVWRRDELAHAMTPAVTTQDNYYEYDGLQQVTRHDRGDLMPASGPPFTGIDPATRQQREDFAFDETGNWTQYQSATPAATWTQDRMNNAANQIHSLTGPTGVIQPTYDKAGNMTTMPKAGDWTTANVLTWDAWNRPVKLTEGAAETGYAYDALTRRTIKTTAAETRNYYYNNQWRAIEERVSGAVKAAYVWSPIDRWTMIRRKRSVTGTLDETRYVLKDYLDPVAIIDTDANVIERYGYEAFGPVRIMDPDFTTRTASACTWNLLFHAEFLDLDSGLYNYGYRYLHPELGRWLSRDPIGEKGGINHYVFVANGGVNQWDALGLISEYFDSPDKAGIAGSLAAKKKTEADRGKPGGPREFAGLVCCSGAKKYYYTEPKPGTPADKLPPGYDGLSNPFDSPCEGTDKPVGTYHSHPGSAGISKRDRELTDKLKIPAYVGKGDNGATTQVDKYSPDQNYNPHQKWNGEIDQFSHKYYNGGGGELSPNINSLSK